MTKAEETVVGKAPRDDMREKPSEEPISEGNPCSSGGHQRFKSLLLYNCILLLLLYDPWMKCKSQTESGPIEEVQQGGIMNATCFTTHTSAKTVRITQCDLISCTTNKSYSVIHTCHFQLFSLCL